MAAARSRVAPIGSAHWVLDERKQADELLSQEVEDFGFSVRNELEWLNEHMSEIFAQNGQYVAPARPIRAATNPSPGTSWMYSRRPENYAARHRAPRATRPPRRARYALALV
jgi:hypothetical protein